MTHRTQKLIKSGILASIISAELIISFALLQASPLASIDSITPVPTEPPILPCPVTNLNCSADATNSTAKPTQAAWRSPDVRSDRSDAPDETVLTEADSQTIWISNPTIGLPRPPLRPNGPPISEKPVGDTTPPSSPTNLRVSTSGLYAVNMSWDPASDAESGIKYYVYAIGTGTTISTEGNLKWWQSTASNSKATASIVMTEGKPIYVSVYAINGADLPSSKIRIGPITPTHIMVGQAGNVISYSMAAVGQDANGNPAAGWSSTQNADIRRFLDKMFPVLYDLYGPPAISYTVGIVRDQRQKASAIFYPEVDEVHLGDTLTYQLLTHELVHAWRNDRILSSNNLWQYNPKYSGFEEGFAQAVSYDAMTEFARRYPSFGLKQNLYQSSHEWDYDFLNVKELRTEDFWSDYGGTKLFWARYEMAAAAIAKIRLAYPNFYKDFNAEYYKRLNADAKLTVSRDLIKAIIQTVSPVIEERPASEWIDAQFIFDCEFTQGPKIFVYPNHYPFREYFIFNQIYFYNTFPNGSDWAYYDGKNWIYHNLNGARGQVTVRDPNGQVVAVRPIKLTPDINPPIEMNYGTAQLTLTTQYTRETWPVVDNSLMVTNLVTNGLYVIETQFYSGPITITNTVTRLMGAAFRDTHGVFGAISGANGGTIGLRHRSFTSEVVANVENQFFHADVPWASIKHTDTNSIDTIPGIVDMRYTDKNGKVYTDSHIIGYGGAMGNQVFMLDLTKMHAVNVTSGPIAATTMPPPPDAATATPTPTPTAVVTATPTPTSVSTPSRSWRVFLASAFDR